MSMPATVYLLTMFRLLHTAHACLSLLLHRCALCCSSMKAQSWTGNTPCNSACKTINVVASYVMLTVTNVQSAAAWRQTLHESLGQFKAASYKDSHIVFDTAAFLCSSNTLLNMLRCMSDCA